MLAVLFVAFGLSSCGDDYDEGIGFVPQPTKHGVFKPTYTADGDTKYTVVYTKDSQGNDVVYVVAQETTEEGTETSVLVSAVVTDVDSKTRMITAEAEESYFGEGVPVTVYLVKALQGNDYTCQIYVNGRQFKIFTLQPAAAGEGLETIAGEWEFYSEETDEEGQTVDYTYYYLYLTDEGYGVAYLNEGESLVPCAFEWDGKNGTLVDENGKQMQLTLNEDAQLVATVDGQEIVLDRLYTESGVEPETFDVIGSALVAAPSWTEIEEPSRVDVKGSSEDATHFALVDPFYAMEPAYADQGYDLEFYYDGKKAWLEEESMQYIGEQTSSGADIFFYYDTASFGTYCYTRTAGNVIEIHALLGYGNSLAWLITLTIEWDEGNPYASSEAAPRLLKVEKEPLAQPIQLPLHKTLRMQKNQPTISAPAKIR